MPGSRFDPELVITNGRIRPSGPLELADGERAKKLYAWVIQHHQDGSSAICSGVQDFQDIASQTGTEWSTRGDDYHDGEFQAGSALAMAVLVSSSPDWDSGSYYWSDAVLLKVAPV